VVSNSRSKRKRRALQSESGKRMHRRSEWLGIFSASRSDLFREKLRPVGLPAAACENPAEGLVCCLAVLSAVERIQILCQSPVFVFRASSQR
jgi:hypothetical protein